MTLQEFLQKHRSAVLRIALSYYVSNGIAAATGLLLVSSLGHAWLGDVLGSIAGVGAIVGIPPDIASPKHGKFWHLMPAAVLGLPVFMAVQFLHPNPFAIGLFIVPATFFAFLGGAWGKRGAPVSISVMFAMIFSLASANHAGPSVPLLDAAKAFACGALGYVVWATIINAVLNARYRVQMLADTLWMLARQMRTQADRFLPEAADSAQARSPMASLMAQQAALADQLQTARDILLESPSTPRRQQLVATLLCVLEMRDHLLACELDLDQVKADPENATALHHLSDIMCGLVAQLEHLSEALLLGQVPQPFVPAHERLGHLDWSGRHDQSAVALARGLSNRVAYIDEEMQRMWALARGEVAPDLALVRATWEMFVSPTTWSWKPFVSLWRWQASPLRHAIRATLAVAFGYTVAMVLPWGTHAYWILLTIVVVLRGSLAQTLERRNHRVAGTLVGCVLAGLFLAGHPSIALMLLVIPLAQAVAHAFAIRRYVVSAVCATIMGLLQAHMLNATVSTGFAMVERIGDTLIGVAIAWVFSYVLPSWEARQIPQLVRRALLAQARHARVALDLAGYETVDNEPELAWRLARREAYDSLSVLVQATQRSLQEPRAVQPPVKLLEHLLAHSYQLLAQLTTVKTIFFLRRSQVDRSMLGNALQQAANALEQNLDLKKPMLEAPKPSGSQTALPDPFGEDVTPWVLRRVALAQELSVAMRTDADQILSRS